MGVIGEEGSPYTCTCIFNVSAFLNSEHILEKWYDKRSQKAHYCSYLDTCVSLINHSALPGDIHNIFVQES